MRTQIAKTGCLPAEYIPPTFLTRTPPPFAQVDGGGLLSRKIFLIFIFQILARIHRMSGLRIFFLFSRFSHSISTRILFFYFFWFSFGFFDIRFSVKLVYIRSILSRLRFLTSLLIFDSHRFRLISALSILCFDSSTLYLFNFSACYKQTSMLIWVWFMLILAILRLSDVFLFVLGVVYRLGIK